MRWKTGCSRVRSLETHDKSLSRNCGLRGWWPGDGGVLVGMFVCLLQWEGRFEADMVLRCEMGPVTVHLSGQGISPCMMLDPAITELDMQDTYMNEPVRAFGSCTLSSPHACCSPPIPSSSCRLEPTSILRCTASYKVQSYKILLTAIVHLIPSFQRGFCNSCSCLSICRCVCSPYTERLGFR